MINHMYIGWYSPTSHQWSKAHIVEYDWLSSAVPVTLCGRKPARRHRTFKRVPQVYDSSRICKHCVEAMPSVQQGKQGVSVWTRILRMLHTVFRHRTRTVGIGSGVA